MNLDFRRHGKQFFFCTACLEGRPQVLSRLVDGEKRPVLTPKGDGVKAVLLAAHGWNAALTMSDFIVMPDHVHFLLIVDFDRDPGFDPISFMHRWREAATEAAAQTAGRLGGLAPQAPGGSGESPDRLVWEKGYWLSLAWYAPQRKAIRDYIRGNPARALWKKAHPDRFRVMPRICHAALDPALPWSALGDPTLLASPFRFPVRLTRKLPVEAQETALSEAVERARRGMIPVCGFLSPAEHELERRLRVEKAARYIKAVPYGLKHGYDPSLEDSRAIAEGRLLLLSSFSPEIPVSPISRANCEAMNGRILRLCGEAAEAICTSQTAGGLAAPRTPCNPAPGGSGGLAPQTPGGSGEPPDRLENRP